MSTQEKGVNGGSEATDGEVHSRPRRPSPRWRLRMPDRQGSGGAMMSDGESMGGKVCLVSGATSGIGLETGRALATRGATVIVLSRSAERCEATARAIREETGNPAVETLAAD